MIHYQGLLHVSHRLVEFLQVSLVFNLVVREEKQEITELENRKQQ